MTIPFPLTLISVPLPLVSVFQFHLLLVFYLSSFSPLSFSSYPIPSHSLFFFLSSLSVILCSYLFLLLSFLPTSSTAISQIIQFFLYPCISFLFSSIFQSSYPSVFIPHSVSFSFLCLSGLFLLAELKFLFLRLSYLLFQQYFPTLCCSASIFTVSPSSSTFLYLVFLVLCFSFLFSLNVHFLSFTIIHQVFFFQFSFSLLLPPSLYLPPLFSSISPLNLYLPILLKIYLSFCLYFSLSSPSVLNARIIFHSKSSPICLSSTDRKWIMNHITIE